ncbi:hypothetical protein BofuT4_uP128020.1 [Botrytis cinerea T4]|uniref:Uncharacterized protein n=1 Tax=Botryotinia fuckeliana (strain T4) TaxID=999810 RepID=G2YR54_BOTF4|nr:hypothetical protein BofuT4_uP128020.1 [Botrytis cinerea T4]
MSGYVQGSSKARSSKAWARLGQGLGKALVFIYHSLLHLNLHSHHTSLTCYLLASLGTSTDPAPHCSTTAKIYHFSHTIKNTPT